MGRRGWQTAWQLAVAMGLATGLSPAARAAGGLTLLTDQPLPMAIRDGGVAQVTVRAVPFALGASTLEGPTAAALDAYLAAVATDCFLFAQAIGHVRPGPESDGDTLAAHRLARARAETVKEALLEAGLPPDSVTSAWDRQFEARQPRVTLWVFARPAGDDCAGTSLPGAVAQVAAFPAPAPPAPSRPAVALASGEPAPGIHIPDPTERSLDSSGRAPARLSPTATRGRADVQRGEVDAQRADVPVPVPGSVIVPFERVRERIPARLGTAGPMSASAVSRVVAPSALAVAPAPSMAVADADISPIGRAALSAAVAAEPEAGPEPSAQTAPAATPLRGAVSRAEVVFEPDSSYLANGAVAQLEALLATLPREAVWEVELQAAVGDAAGKLPADKAVAYNQWLADRRQSRLEEWLGTRSVGPVLRVHRSLLPHDPSRRVVISARPLP